MTLNLLELNKKNHSPLIVTLTKDQISQCASSIINFVEAGDWLFLDGDLGAGKTALAREISKVYGSENFFTSPTFSILNIEKLPKPIGNVEFVLHLDLYRIKSGKELCFIGLEEEFRRENSVVIFEWPHTLENEEWEYFFQTTGCQKPKKILNVHIHGQENNRVYEFTLENFSFLI